MAKQMLKDAPSKHGRQGGQEIAEAQMALKGRSSRLDQLVEKWDRTEVGHKLSNVYSVSPRKARVTAMMLEKQLGHMKTLKEAGIQISSAFGTTPENVLRIVRIGVANSNRADIFTEWPLVSTNDALYYIDRVYGSTLRGATAQDRIYDVGPVAADYASAFNTLSSTPGSGDGVTTAFSGTFSPVPLKPYSVYVIVGNVIIGNDDGSGNLQGSGIASGTINYATGIYSFTATTAPVIGASIQLQGVWDSEADTNFSQYGDVQLKVTKKNFHLYQHPLYYSYSKFSELVFDTTGLGDFEEQVVKGVGDEHAKRRDYKAFQLAKRVAGSNAPFTFDADFAGAGEDNDFNHAQRIATTINNISGAIYDDLKRGEINKIVGNSIAVNYLKKHMQWKADNSQPRVGGSYLAGKLYDIDVYVTPADNSTLVATSTSGELLCLYKNPQEEGEPSLAFGVLTEYSAALDYPELFRRGVAASVEGELVIQPKFIRLLKVNNIT